MDKQEFLKKLRHGLPAEDREERILFYTEMIDDRMEEGLSEEEAVASVGSLEEILSQCPEANVLSAAPKQKRQMKTWEIVLLVLGSPVWFSLLVAAAAVAVAAVAVLLSGVAVLLSGVIVLWSVFVATAAVSLAGLVSGAALVFAGSGISGTAMIGAAITCAGLAIFCFCGSLAASKGLVLSVKKLVRWSKNRFGEKEALV